MKNTSRISTTFPPRLEELAETWLEDALYVLGSKKVLEIVHRLSENEREKWYDAPIGRSYTGNYTPIVKKRK